MTTTNVLFEVGLEEMPARFIKDTERQLQTKTALWLNENRLTYQTLKTFITPRRFTVQIIDLADKQPDLEIEVRGPAKKIALDDQGEWSKAAIGFTKGQGASVEDIYYQEIKDTEYIFVKKFTAGKSATELLPSFKEVILSLNFPKNMRWANNNLRYIRPIKWILALNDDELIPFDINGVKSGKNTFGHRFLGEEITLTDPLEYQAKLKEQFVLADRKERMVEITAQIKQLTEANDWGSEIDQELLEEVTDLVEYPTVFFGSFSQDYLIIPEEALITSMKVHQRYFPVRNKQGDLLAFFIGVRNGNSDYLDNVVKGNEKVLNARLADGVFFYQEDQKHSIDVYNEKLTRIVFQQQLGTVAEKVNRVRDNAGQIAKNLQLTETEIKQVDRTAEISKFDLVTQMVDEFPELQGIMGTKYAHLFGEEKVVADSINEHYLPRHANDELPRTKIAAILSVAEKLDTIVGCIGVDLIPTGSQDPYALRRQAMGVIQILKQEQWLIKLEDLVDLTLKQYQDSIIKQEKVASVRENVLEFFKARIAYLAKEEQISNDLIKAVADQEVGVISQLLAKAHLLAEKRDDEAFKPTQEALGRVINLAKLNQADQVDPDLFENETEKELFATYQLIEPDYRTKINQGLYVDALELLEQLTPKIAMFFDQTMVMVDDESLKTNRMALLNLIAELIHLIANFKEIEWKQHQ